MRGKLLIWEDSCVRGRSCSWRGTQLRDRCWWVSTALPLRTSSPPALHPALPSAWAFSRRCQAGAGAGCGATSGTRTRATSPAPPLRCSLTACRAHLGALLSSPPLPSTEAAHAMGGWGSGARWARDACTVLAVTGTVGPTTRSSGDARDPRAAGVRRLRAVKMTGPGRVLTAKADRHWCCSRPSSTSS